MFSVQFVIVPLGLVLHKNVSETREKMLHHYNSSPYQNLGRSWRNGINNKITNLAMRRYMQSTLQEMYGTLRPGLIFFTHLLNVMFLGHLISVFGMHGATLVSYNPQTLKGKKQHVKYCNLTSIMTLFSVTPTKADKIVQNKNLFCLFSIKALAL